MEEQFDNTTDFPIEDVYPIPKRVGTAGPERQSRDKLGKYPTKALEVGQSFFVPIDQLPQQDLRVGQRCLVAVCYRVSIDFRGRQFTTQIIKGDDVDVERGEGVRVWRTR